MGQAGRIGLTIIGTAVGTAFGMPGLGAVLGGMAGNIIFPHERESIEGPRLDDLHVQISSYGAPIYKLWGTMRISGNVIWAAPITEIRTESDEGGKGGVVLANYRYFGTFAIAVCEGPIDQILRIWADTKLIYDIQGSTEHELEEGARSSRRVHRSNALRNIHIHTGSETQEPDIWIESYEGAGNVPGHRGLCYVVFKDFALADYGNRIPNFSFEVSTNTSGIVPYDELAGLGNVATSDNIVFFEDGMYFVIEGGGSWHKVNTITNEIVAEAEFDDIPDASDFDIDERGYIYTSKTYDEAGKSVVTRLSSWFDEGEGDNYDSEKVNTPGRIRVSRAGRYPFLVVIPDDGATLEITPRDDYEFENSEGWLSISPPSGNVQFASVDIDDSTGIIWAVCKDLSDATIYTYIMRISVDISGEAETESWNKTPDLQKAHEILYDEDTDQVVVASEYEDKICFYDAGDLTSLAQLGAISGNCTNSWMKSAWRKGTYDGFLYYAEDNNIIRRINVATHEIDKSWTAPTASPMGDWNGGSCYDPLTHSVIVAVDGADFDFAKIYLERAEAVAVSLADIVDDICEDAGLDPSTELDTSELDAITVHGYCVNRRMTGRAALQSLMDAYFFDGIESDGLLKFPVRGGASVEPIPESALAAHVSDSQRPQELTTTRQQELELPRVVEVSYIDYGANYQAGVQRESRQITQSRQMANLQLPIALTHDDAKQICVKLLANLWMERNRHNALVPRQYSYLDAGDVVTVTEDDNVHTLRIEQIDYQGGSLALAMISEEASVYSSNAGGVPLPTAEDEIDWPGPTIMAVIDCPLLSSYNNTPGVYVATLGMTEAWQGAVIYKSNDDAVTWQQWTISNRDAIIGKSGSALADVADPFVWDEGNSVNVRLFDSDDALESETEANVLAGANAAILGDEIISWRTATLQSDGSYTLSGLLRGRYGTEWATDDHAVGETFVVLNTATLHFLSFPVEEKDLARDFTAISIGMGWGSGFRLEATSHLRNMMPLAPVHVSGTIDDDNNLTISWIRRTRYGGEWLDSGGPPLGETSEVYEVDILDDDGEVVRTLTTNVESVIYTAAQQTTDGLTPGDEVDVIVYQVSSVVGRGFGTAATVNRVRVDVDLSENIVKADASVTDIDYALEDVTPP